MRSVCRNHITLRAIAVAAVVGAVAVPAAHAQSDPQAQREQVRSQAAQVAQDVVALKAEDAQVQAALASLKANVAKQRAKLAAANKAKAAADADLKAATAAVTKAKKRFEELDAATDALVVESYVTPVGDEALDAFRAHSLTDAAVKRTLEEIQTENDQRLLDDLSTARRKLSADRTRKREAASTAADTKKAASQALAKVKGALAQQQQFAADVEARLNAKLAEADALRQTDAALSAKIIADQRKLAASLSGISAPVGAPTPIPGVPGGLATVACPSGGSITVSATIADNLSRLLAAAEADGVHLCGGGYRDPQEQIQLRMEHCGTSYYEIYQAPASSCDPPTAIPGTSQHEVGLAIDFTCNGGGTVTWGDVCSDWLLAHAGDYGFINLPTEPWHYSTTGR